MNWFDSAILHFVNQVSQQSSSFDSAVLFLSQHHFIKAGLLAAMFWWLWFLKDENQLENRQHVVTTLFGCFAAMLVARILMLTLPYRVRPIHDESLDFILSYGMEATGFKEMSSFPSDHAVFFFSIVTGLTIAKRKLGMPLFIFTIIIICLPRIYLGLHYPTDIVAGAVLGIGIGIFVNFDFIRQRFAPPMLRLEERLPSLFYVVFFLLTYQVADMFNSSRAIVRSLISFF